MLQIKEPPFVFGKEMQHWVNELGTPCIMHKHDLGAVGLTEGKNDSPKTHLRHQLENTIYRVRCCPWVEVCDFSSPTEYTGSGILPSGPFAELLFPVLANLWLYWMRGLGSQEHLSWMGQQA